MIEERKPTGKLTWKDWNNREHSRPVNYTLDIRDFQGRAAFALLAIAANQHLGTSDLERLLEAFGVNRSRSYVQRRRWMVDPVKHNPGAKPNEDGQDERARKIIKEHPTKSARALVRLLAENGITRKKTWVWENRCE
jgi:hypothetical protein